MKKIISTLFLLLTLFACGEKNDEPKQNNDEPKQNEEIDITGVWENGNKFISFSNDFYVAYIADKFIDSGTYSVNKDSKQVTCNNTYFNRKTNYTIKEIKDNQLTVDYSSTDIHGKPVGGTLTLTKTDKTPTTYDNPLIGKSHSYLSSSAFGTITYNFTSPYRAEQKASKQKYKNILYYIYLDEYFYYQKFYDDDYIQVPTIGGWNTNAETGEITVINVGFNSDGTISYIEGATDEKL